MDLATAEADRLAKALPSAARYPELLAACRAAGQDPQAVRQAAVAFVTEANDKLARFVARRFWASLPFEHEREDLEQVMRMALFRAAGKFNPDIGVKFSTWACKIMINEATSYRRQILRRGLTHVGDTSSKVPPTKIEVYTGTPTSERSAGLPTGLNGYIDPHAADDPADLAAERDEQGLRVRQLRELVRHLPERHALLLIARVGFNGGLREIAEEAGLSKERVRQIVGLSLHRCRKAAAQGGEVASE